LVLEIVRDLNGDGNPLNDQQYGSVFAGVDVSLTRELLPATYFVVVRGATTMTSYTLTVTPLATIPLLLTDPGNDHTGAVDLGVISGIVTASDMVARGLDEKDYFRFNLNAGGSIRISLSGQSTSNRAFFRIYGGVLNNGVFVPGVEIASGEDRTLDLSLGVYFILVEGGITTPFTLTVEKKS
jgi:hypothetical protein